MTVAGSGASLARLARVYVALRTGLRRAGTRGKPPALARSHPTRASAGRCAKRQVGDLHGRRFGDVHPVIPVRVTVIPHWRPACRADVRGLRLHTDRVEYLPDVGAVRDERNQAHLSAAHRAQQREHLVNSGDQHFPQVVRRYALGWHGLGRGWERVAQRYCHGRRALARSGCLRRCSQRRHCTAQRRIRCQHTKVAVAVGAWRWHQGGKRSRAARSCAAMQTRASTEKPLCW